MRCEIYEHINTKSLTHSLIHTIVCCAPADRVRYTFDFNGWQTRDILVVCGLGGR